MTFAQLAAPIVQAKGFTRALIAFLSGAASTLGLEPIGLWPMLFVTFPILVWLLDGAIAASDFVKPAPTEAATDERASAGSQAMLTDIKKNGRCRNRGAAVTPAHASRAMSDLRR